MRDLKTEIRDINAQIGGLQVENRRILERVLVLSPMVRQTYSSLDFYYTAL